MLVENASFSNIDGSKFGFVIMGCQATTASVMNEWAGPVLRFLQEEGAILQDAVPETFFEKVQVLATTGGRTDLVFVISEAGNKQVNMGKFAIVRLSLPDCSWIEDFVDNYKDQFNSELTLCGVDPSQHSAECPMCDSFEG
jgi:hypothetical protein